MFTDLTAEETTTALDTVVKQLLSAAQIPRPPVNALLVAIRLGYQVIRDERQTARARILRTPGATDKPVIVLGPEPREERRQWAVAHELGEASAERICTLLNQDPRELRPAAREQLANRLASRLLIPTAWWEAACAESDLDLPLLKRRFATASHELLARRMLDLDRQLVVTVCDQGTRIWRAAVGGRRPAVWSADEESAWRTCFDEVRYVEHRGPPRIRVWPIHEPGWLREIVVTEYADYAGE